jgi:DNA-binding transcriptional MerR regulator
MRQTSKVEGTKIAQAAKDLNVTSVTIRRYLTEFGIDTTTDENGIKVLPDIALEELKEVRRLKEDGLTNPKVMEILEERRTNQSKMGATSAPPASKARSARATAAALAEEASADEDADAEVALPEKKKPTRRNKVEVAEAAEVEPQAVAEEVILGDEDGQSLEGGVGAESRAKHTLTCQTCGKAFEHMNPRLRDCLDCYRTKRKERRRGGADKHKNVIQHPLAQQVANKTAQSQPAAPAAVSLAPTNGSSAGAPPPLVASPIVASVSAAPTPALQKGPVRNYRKAIEETRHITGSLKRRLERPDLPEGERRWLEQIYAYQLILHQGWRHLSDYKTVTQQQGKEE